MADVIRQSLDSTRGIWDVREIEVVSEIEDDLPPVRGDHGRLVQVLVNLISNAIKFTERSSIVCRAHRDGSSVLVSVSDHGVGIAQDDLEIIFDKFKQGGDTLTDKPAGTGLGLPICRQIVEYHGGQIWAESEPGKGSVFFFSIPMVRIRTTDDSPIGEECECLLPTPDGAMLVREPVDQDAAPLILVVDDDPTLGLFLKQIFTDQGFRDRKSVV